MGPLIPFVFSSEFSLLLALAIGIAFGIVLEQAGFSSTKKLVGLFYGYDFTVLRVFFTAGITAMIGVLILSDYGLLDISVIYINPTFLRSAIVGGVIMGLGFVLGGFCPGTSVCAAAIGKLDAMVFIVGALLGILVFTEFYPLIEQFYLADKLGNITMFEQLGMPRLVFAILLTLIALGAFYVTWLIENKVNDRDNSIPLVLKKKYIIAMGVPIIILLLLAVLPNKQEYIQNKIAQEKEQKKCVFKEISADKLASEITSNYYELNIIDVRTPEEFKENHLPLAINIPFNDIENREWETYFTQTQKLNVFYADNDTLTKMSCLKAKYIGKSDNYILKETAAEFNAQFFNLTSPAEGAQKYEQELYHFRHQAGVKMRDIMDRLENLNAPVKKSIKKVSGGCS